MLKMGTRIGRQVMLGDWICLCWSVCQVSRQGGRAEDKENRLRHRSEGRHPGHLFCTFCLMCLSQAASSPPTVKWLSQQCWPPVPIFTGGTLSRIVLLVTRGVLKRDCPVTDLPSFHVNFTLSPVNWISPLSFIYYLFLSDYWANHWIIYREMQTPLHPATFSSQFPYLTLQSMNLKITGILSVIISPPTKGNFVLC